MQGISTEIEKMMYNTFSEFGLLKQFFESPVVACVSSCFLTLYSSL